MPNPSLRKISRGGDKKLPTNPKVKVIAQLEFELAYYDVAIQHISHDATQKSLLRNPKLEKIWTIWLAKNKIINKLGWLVGWFYGILTLIGLFKAEVCLFLQAITFVNNYNMKMIWMIVTRFHLFLSNTNYFLNIFNP